MPTIEERLAALETKMSALTETTPTTYYEHQYSGEEIDNAVARALPNGAIDQAVGTFVRPNLLDNWYLGNPVDQRGGKIIQHGKMAYRDAACTIEQGPVDETAKPVYKVSDQVYAFTGSDNNTYYVKAADVVRGYTGKVYGVDRWSSLSNIVTMVVGDDGLTVSSTAESGAVEICQYFESYIKAGTILTLSAIVSKTEASQNGILRVKVYGGGADLQTNLPARAMDHELVSVTNAARADVIGCVMRISNGDGYTVHAIKLELGDTQTLAHQDAAGNWVLNEVPEYGEQLRRCQRYYYQVHYNQYETIGFAYDGPEYAFIIIPLPTEMRGATPTLKIIGDISIGGKVRTLTGCSCHGCEAIIGVNYTAQPSSAGATYAYSTSAGGVTISIIYDL